VGLSDEEEVNPKRTPPYMFLPTGQQPLARVLVKGGHPLGRNVRWDIIWFPSSVTVEKGSGPLREKLRA